MYHFTFNLFSFFFYSLSCLQQSENATPSGYKIHATCTYIINQGHSKIMAHNGKCFALLKACIVFYSSLFIYISDVFTKNSPVWVRPSVSTGVLRLKQSWPALGPSPWGHGDDDPGTATSPSLCKEIHSVTFTKAKWKLF